MMEQITQTANGYQVTIGGLVMSVPNDPANEDWQRVQAAIKAGHKVEASPVPTPEDRRAAMVISKMQGVLTLGEKRWTEVLEYRDGHATWGEKIIIDSAGNWERLSENIAFFGYLLGMDADQMDELFLAAAAVKA